MVNKVIFIFSSVSLGNDSIFTARLLQRFLTNTNIKVKRTGFHAPWQNGVYERTIGILRQEFLNHIIPLHEKHLERLLREYIHGYYNPARTHQGINGQTPILSEEPVKTVVADTVLTGEPILNGLYHRYKKIAKEPQKMILFTRACLTSLFCAR